MTQFEFGSAAAAAVLKADKKLRRQEELDNQPKKWYIVSVDESTVSNYRVKALDKNDAMDRCINDGTHLEVVDCTDSDPRGAELDTNQED